MTQHMNLVFISACSLFYSFFPPTKINLELVLYRWSPCYGEYIGIIETMKALEKRYRSKFVDEEA